MLSKIVATTAGLIGSGALAATLAFGAPGATAASTPATSTIAVAQRAPDSAERGQLGERAIVLALFRATVEETGLTNQEVLEAVKGGQSLAEVAATRNSNGDAVVDAVTAKAKDRLDRQVQAGRISQERAGTLLQRLRDRATDLVNDNTLGIQISERQSQAQARYTMPALVKATSEATGLPVGDITGRLRDGESLREIIESGGGDPEAVLDAATAAFRAAADGALDARR